MSTEERQIIAAIRKAIGPADTCELHVQWCVERTIQVRTPMLRPGARVEVAGRTVDIRPADDCMRRGSARYHPDYRVERVGTYYGRGWLGAMVAAVLGALDDAALAYGVTTRAASSPTVSACLGLVSTSWLTPTQRWRG